MFLDSDIYNSSGSVIVTMNLCGWLGVSNFFKGEMDDLPSLELTTRALGSVSAAEEATNCKGNVRIWIGVFNFIGCLSYCSHPWKKCPVVLIFALGAPRYESSE